jgi:trimeric autotransporter adhesin
MLWLKNGICRCEPFWCYFCNVFFVENHIVPMKTQNVISSLPARALSLLLLIALAPSSSTAQQIITYQGLATTNSTPLSGAHNVTLAIYADSIGGTALYTESQFNVPFSNGLFNIEIGTNPANPLPIFDAGSYNASVRPAPNYFLGISVDGAAELTPRSKLGTSPTAWSSRFADSSRAAGTAATALKLAPNAGGVVTSINTLGGAVTLSGGGSTTVSSNGQTITISSSGGAGGTGIQGIQNTDGTITITNATGPTATISVNPVKVQSRVTGSAPSGSFLTGINQDGTVSSGVPASGITGSGMSGTIPVWTSSSTQGNSLLSDIDSTLTYLGSSGFTTDGNINTKGVYTISTEPVLSIEGDFNLFVGSYAGISNTTAEGNTCVGYEAGKNNTSGANTFLGSEAGIANSSGGANTFLGYHAGDNNSSGNNNTFSGTNAGFDNTSGQDNVFIGDGAGFSNTTGTFNTAIGHGADVGSATLTNATAIGQDAIVMASNTVQLGNSSVTAVNTSGAYQIGGGTVLAANSSTENLFAGLGAGPTNTGAGNTFVGNLAGFDNTSGQDNVFIGDGAGEHNTTASFNTFLGATAGEGNTTGSGNTLIGEGANAGSDDLIDATAIGVDASVTASEHVVIGSASVTSIGGFVGWSNLSDGRFKNNVQSNVPGLEFISLLTPITYTLDVRGLNRHIGVVTSAIDEPGIQKKESIVYSGFIAQDVETAANSIGYNFDGVGKPENEKDHYTLAYASFVPSLVKSVQELNAKIDEQAKIIAELQKEVEAMKAKNQ